MTLIDGDILEFNVPAQVGLPPTIQDLDIQPIARDVEGQRVSDTLTVDMVGQKLIVTFEKVAPTTEVYKWKLHKMKNPPSL